MIRLCTFRSPARMMALSSFQQTSDKARFLKAFEVEEARTQMQKTITYPQSDMDDFATFKEYFPHSSFCLAGGLKDTLVAGEIVSLTPTHFWVDWGFKYPLYAAKPEKPPKSHPNENSHEDMRAELRRREIVDVLQAKIGDYVVAYITDVEVCDHFLGHELPFTQNLST